MDKIKRNLWGEEMLAKLALLIVVMGIITNIGPGGWSEEEDNTPGGFGLTLATNKAVYSPGEPISITLTVFNCTEDAITLNFTSAQRYDFVVKKKEKKIWQWSSDKLFAQLIGEEKLKTGDTLIYEETYRPGQELAPGVYSVTGKLTCKENPLQATIYIRIIKND